MSGIDAMNASSLGTSTVMIEADEAFEDVGSSDMSSPMSMRSTNTMNTSTEVSMEGGDATSIKTVTMAKTVTESPKKTVTTTDVEIIEEIPRVDTLEEGVLAARMATSGGTSFMFMPRGNTVGKSGSRYADVADDDDEDDEDDDGLEIMDDAELEDESLGERLWGLTEMFPKWVRDGVGKTYSFSSSKVETLFGYSREVVWVLTTSAVVLFFPVAIEMERYQIDEFQKRQQTHVLLGGKASSGGAGVPMPPMAPAPFK